MTDEELIARLRVDEPVCEEHFTANLAADRIEALVKDRDAGAKDYCALMDRYDALSVRAERLEAALRCALGEHDDHYGPLCDSNDPHWSNDARAALKGADHE